MHYPKSSSQTSFFSSPTFSSASLYISYLQSNYYLHYSLPLNPSAMPLPRFLLITFPAQGHINPSLQFAKRLIRIGVEVTFVTTLHAKSRMSKTSFPPGLTMITFSDGYDDGFKPGDDHDKYMSEIRWRGSEALNHQILAAKNEGKPYSCLVYTLLLPWASEVARAHQLPYTLLWIQPAIVLDIYYYYFNGYKEIFSKCNDSSYKVALPGLDPLTSRDLPSFLVPSNSNHYSFALPNFEEQLKLLDEETNPKILVNTFDALEPKALKAIDKFNMVGIGPLLKDPSDTSFGGDIFRSSKNDYIVWLNSQAESSVIYVSFGSISVLSKRQTEEIGRGLVSSNRPFLWVIREDPNKKEEEISLKKELEEKGMIVPWCDQVKVLSNPSVGCFVSHCGWNSTLESLVSGVPVVGFPQWSDQGTNAKLIEEDWKIGVRVAVGNEEDGIVDGDEIKRCLNFVMGDGKKGKEIRENAKKWKVLAREAVKEGGSSDKNLKGFVDEIIFT